MKQKAFFHHFKKKHFWEDESPTLMTASKNAVNGQKIRFQYINSQKSKVEWRAYHFDNYSN